MQLANYQKIGVGFLAERPTAGLFDDMRLGKTRQVLMAAKEISAQTICVVAKATGVYEWETQSRGAGFEPVILKSKDTPLKNRLNIMSYNAMSSQLHEKLMGMEFDLVVGDESDAFKNFKAKRTKAFYGPKLDRKGGITEKAKYVWVVTGTPILNNPAEMYPCIRALFPDAIVKRNGKPMTYWDFVNRYCTTINNGFGIQITGGKNLADLRDRLRGRVLRRTKSEVWEEFNKPVTDLLLVQGKIKDIPNEEIKKVEEALETNDLINALASVAEQAPTLRRLTGLAKVSGILEWLDDNMHQIGKIIIFAQHRDVIKLLQEKLPYKCVSIIGGMSSEEKKNAYTQFQEDDSVRIFIGQNQAARDSIPLWKASIAISLEPDWVPGNNEQMMDRMSYIDKKEHNTFYYATLRGSIDERIQKALLRKKDITDQLGF